MLKLQDHKTPNVAFDFFQPFKVKITKSGKSHRDKQAIQHTSKQEAFKKRQIEKEREDTERERENKTARVKWGRGK